MARFWFKDEKLREDVTAFLRHCPAGRILADTELKELRVFFPDHRYGELIFLMNPGTLVHPCFFGTYAPAGMHGYHPDDPHSSGAYLSNVRDHSPGENRDLFDVIVKEASYAAGGQGRQESAY
jgi:hypothetical protein